MQVKQKAYAVRKQFFNSLRTKALRGSRLECLSVDGATHAPKDGVESRSGSSFKNVAEIYAQLVLRLNFIWYLLVFTAKVWLLLHASPRLSLSDLWLNWGSKSCWHLVRLCALPMELPCIHRQHRSKDNGVLHRDVHLNGIRYCEVQACLSSSVSCVFWGYNAAASEAVNH